MDQTISGLSIDTLDRINQVLSRYVAVDEAVIYGSRAKGTFRPGSDIDLTLKGGLLTTTELLAIGTELDDLMLPYQFDLSLFHQIDHADLMNHIKRVGKVLYQKGK